MESARELKESSLCPANLVLRRLLEEKHTIRNFHNAISHVNGHVRIVKYVRSSTRRDFLNKCSCLDWIRSMVSSRTASFHKPDSELLA